MTTEFADAGMLVQFDVEIPTTSGGFVRADVYRPEDDQAYPTLITYGPYGKNLPFEQGYSGFFNAVKAQDPATFANTTGKYAAWEVIDPEKWIPEGYAVVRVDARGTGRSPGVVDNFSPHEARDYYDCIEWAAAQPWSTGKVGSTGSSYLGIMQWLVAGLKPPHLAAMYVSEAASDYYRDIAHHGGILNEFTRHWFATQFGSIQHGLGERGYRNKFTGELASGPETLTVEELAANVGRDLFRSAADIHFADDDFYRDRTAAYDDIEVPFASVGSWGAQGIHLRGNIECYLRAASKQKWLSIVNGSGFVFFHGERGRRHQLRFFDHFLKGTGDWLDEPEVTLEVRNPDGSHRTRTSDRFPLAESEWTTFYLNAVEETMQPTPAPPASVEYRATGSGATFTAPASDRDIEVTGPIAVTLYISSSTTDADLFVVLRMIDPAGEEVLYRGQPDPKTPPAMGWLRASHRAIDPELSLPYRPHHPHSNTEQLEPNRVYEMQIELWPTSIVVPAGYRLALSTYGKDFDHGQDPVELAYAGDTILMRGVGNFVHTDVSDRPDAVFDNEVTVYTGPDHPSRLLLPIIDL